MSKEGRAKQLEELDKLEEVLRNPTVTVPVRFALGDLRTQRELLWRLTCAARAGEQLGLERDAYEYLNGLEALLSEMIRDAVKKLEEA